VDETIPVVGSNFMTYLASHSVRCANIEGPMFASDNRLKKAGPNLTSSELLVDFIKKTDINLACTGNNHFFDFGVDAAWMTVDSLGIPSVGCSFGLVQHHAHRLRDEHGQVISIVAAGESFHGSISDQDSPKSSGVLSLTTSRFRRLLMTEIDECDIVIVLAHCGLEGENLPLPEWKEVLRSFVELGARAVIAHHTHTVLPFESLGNSRIYYGIGNLHMPQRYSGGYSEGLCVTISTGPGGAVDFNEVPFVNSAGVIEIATGRTEGVKRLEDVDGYKMQVENMCIRVLERDFWPGLMDVFNGIGHRPGLAELIALAQSRMARKFVDRSPDVAEHRLLYLEHLFRVESNRWTIERALRSCLANENWKGLRGW
jgi:hypothetical protein